MEIPTSAIAPLFIASFILLAFQYYRIDPDRRLLNLHFGMMLGAVLLIFLRIMLPGPDLSMVLFALGLGWLGVTLYMFRHLPPRKH